MNTTSNMIKKFSITSCITSLASSPHILRTLTRWEALLLFSFYCIVFRYLKQMKHGYQSRQRLNTICGVNTWREGKHRSTWCRQPKLFADAPAFSYYLVWIDWYAGNINIDSNMLYFHTCSSFNIVYVVSIFSRGFDWILIIMKKMRMCVLGTRVYYRDINTRLQPLKRNT